MGKAPTSATIRTYHVGFGDCFLISFGYSRKSEKHVLIDFGSTAFPKGVPKSRMMDIAENIKQRTGGKLHAVVTKASGEISRQSSLARAIRYMLAHWNGLTAFLEDGRLSVDTNVVERSMRPIALGRRNSLFVGSAGGGRSWAILASLINTAKLNGVDPFTWLSDVLERIVSGAVKIKELDCLLPWHWQARRQETVARAA